MGQLALSARAPDVIDAGRGRTPDFGQRRVVESGGFAREGAGDGHGLLFGEKRIASSE